MAHTGLAFTLGVARYPAIAAALADKGYAQKEQDYVWVRLAKLGALPSAPSSQGVSDKVVREAIIELDAWDEPNFAVIRAALQRFFPAYVDVIFNGLEPKQGPEAVYSVSTLLDRLDKLEQSGDSEAPAALDLLSSRGYSKTERQRLRKLITTTQSFAPKPPLSDADRVQVLGELYAWITDWSATATATIKRRQHLIALGLASPRKPKNKGGPGGGNDGAGEGGDK